MGAAGACRACGLGLREDARFCDRCGTPVSADPVGAEYKHVTVMFADVVRSMEIASALGPERLRELMTELVERSAGVVRGFGGTVNQFTGDGFMAVFGAPVAMEDHAFRACLAALDIQAAARGLAATVKSRDGIELKLRIGLNSGEVVAGEIASGGYGYTTIGAHVGLAQRMESVAPPGGVALSESTARLVETVVELSVPEMAHIKGVEEPVPLRRLIGVARRVQLNRRDAPLVGRRDEVARLAAVLESSSRGEGCVVGVRGPAGIGKSRMVLEAAAMAATHGVEVFITYSESHTNQVPFRVVARLLRSVFGIGELGRESARAQLRTRMPTADPDDLLLLDDLLGIGDPADVSTPVTPNARQRRLAALLEEAAVARTAPAIYVVEDAHWIDEASESMLVEFATVVLRTNSLLLVTCRPEYHGALLQAPGVETIALAPLSGVETVALTSGLLGDDPSVIGLAAQIAERAAGNPFFADEIVRDLAGRGVLAGDRGGYTCRDDDADITVPGTLQAVIAARIDRLGPVAKQALYAGSVIGGRFRPDLLDAVLGENRVSDTAIAELLQVELVDELQAAPRPEYGFRHPLIRAVAYESQLRTGRADLHRRAAAAIERNSPGSADQDAALIAEHLEAAGDLGAAFDWHMRAGTWSLNRDRAAARGSWHRARQVANHLPADEANRTAMQIAPLALLCGTVWRTGGGLVESEFAELRELCTASGDRASLAMGMAGVIMGLAGHNRLREASELASELIELVDAIGNSALTTGLLIAAVYAKSEVGEMSEALRLAQRVIDLADGDPDMGNLLAGSPLALATRMRGLARLCLGIDGWRSDGDAAIAMASGRDPTSHVSSIMYKYVVAIPVGALRADSVALRETAEALRVAEQCGDDFTLALAQLTRGQVLVRHDARREEGFELLFRSRENARENEFTLNALAIIEPEMAREKARNGDLDGAITQARAAIDEMFVKGSMFLRGVGTSILVESLLERRGDGDLTEAQAAVDRLATVACEPGFIIHELPLLRMRGLIARAHGQDAVSRDYLERYRAKAEQAGFEPLVAAASA